jgi:hypothetical protein
VHADRQRVLDAAYQATPDRFVRRAPTAPPVSTAAWINKPTTTEEAAHEKPRRSVSPGLTGSGGRTDRAGGTSGPPQARPWRRRRGLAERFAVLEVTDLQQRLEAWLRESQPSCALSVRRGLTAQFVSLDSSAARLVAAARIAQQRLLD